MPKQGRRTPRDLQAAITQPLAMLVKTENLLPLFNRFDLARLASPYAGWLDGVET